MKRSIWLLFASSCLWLAGCSEPAGGTGTGDDNGKPGGSLEEEYVEIPDPLFSAFLVKQFDKDKDGRISKAEAEEVTAIRVTENWEIASVEGIASFPNLKTFEFCGDFEHTRPLTGLDAPVRDFVRMREETIEFEQKWHDLLDVVMPGYVAEGKQQLAIGVGCTGGQHRSVALAEATGDYLKSKGYRVSVAHRDLRLAERGHDVQRESDNVLDARAGGGKEA